MPELRHNRTIGEIAILVGISRQTLHRVMAGEIAISPDMAARLGKLCGNGPGIWIRLQGALRYLGSDASATQKS
jgi:antitoxin HigA-1